jgi:aryl-alcohol dehydrogenase-like predicted oxidoreductase
VKSGLIPGTELTVSRLAFGTASLHHLLRSKQRQDLLSAAIEAGFSHLDTSPYYGNGLAEEEIGRLRGNGARNITIASKVGLYPPEGSSASTAAMFARKAAGKFWPRASAPVHDWSIRKAQTSLDQTLRRIRRDYLDILYLHEPSYGCLDEMEFVEWLQQQKSLGKIRYWGLAGDSSQFGRWVDVQHPLGEILQVRDSLPDQGVASTVKSRPGQFRYGYLSSANNSLQNADVLEILREALRINAEATIIVSTRKVSRIENMAKAAS